MTYQPDLNALRIAEATILSDDGVVVSILDKGKGINKFGANRDIDTGTEETVMTLQGTETSETYVFTNAIITS